MPDPSPRPHRSATPVQAAHSVDATGLQSMHVDADAVDDLNLLAASLQPSISPRTPTPIVAKAKRSSAGSARSTLIPPLLTGGAICEALAIAWFCTEPDSPYRRVSVAVPIVLITAGFILLAAAVINMTLVARGSRRN